MFHDRGDYAIHSDYFTLEELRRQFEELLRAYRDYEQLPKTTKDQIEDEESESANKALKKKALLASQTFEAIFKEKIPKHPTLLSSMGFDRSVDMMSDWASEVLPRFEGEESFSTIEQCSSRLRELSSDSDESSTEQPRWPFIRKLRVHLNAYILSQGLIIADLPGLRDSNSARKAITERYVRQCHQIFAVARIDRAITDESVKDIFELARRANLAKVDVVCTRSEDVQIREAKHDWIEERARIEELQSAIDTETHELGLLREEMEDLGQDTATLTREDEQDLRQLQYEYHKTERSKLSNEFELLSLVVGLRNAKVSKLLLEQYRDDLHALALKIFCVSNKVYWDHRGKPRKASMPYLTMSGIMELRQYCIGIVADDRLRVTKEFINDQVPAFLGSVELWVEAGAGNASAERKQRILHAVSAVQQALEEVRTS